MGYDFTTKALYTGIWIAAFSLFMELLGFNTQKWITAGGFGTVLLTLAGREIFTNFLSSVMINATRPFVVNEWIKTKIDGVEVSGIVEIYISCFVKTSHFEEYLNVQEAVMLDLLRIVGHHKARLATQIRTVQKSYGNADFDNIPFGEDMYSRVRGRPLLIDTSAWVSDDKAKPRPPSHGEQKVKASGSLETKSASPESNSEKQEQRKLAPEDGWVKNTKNGNAPTIAASSDPEDTERQVDSTVSVANPKKEPRPAFEDNIVLGVALDGSKRTLPIDDGTNPYISLSETDQATVEAASSLKDKKGQGPKHSGQEKADKRNADR
ncbi:hypothetical protein PR202_gb25922 [Eleusine coracana subsp. coracana]|uniref:Uncharacterized protein n=1 Tax=Eleusine coracana subsp. coracana TaxID=191504 RepID=A0AAV5FRW9_ELECO|nr:hypothetical protein PR202_gb25922 [Eleusine coracana subsp. coracana]